MPRRESSPITRTHVWLFVSDLAWLRDTYGDTIGVAKAVRTIVRAFRQRVEEKQAAVRDVSLDLDVDLNTLSAEHDRQHESIG